MSAIFDGFKKTGIDNDVELKLAEHCAMYNIDALNAVKLFPVLARRQMLKRFLAHVELFQKTLNIPGDIAELGVFRGLGLMTWANLLECYCIGDRTKMVYGFDNWEGFTAMCPQDGDPVEAANKVSGGFNPIQFYEEIKAAIEIYDSDRFIPWKPRIELVNGNIESTAPNFVKDNLGVRFSLIHFDCDLYLPTIAALEAFWPRLSRGGVMIFDEYGIHDWPGETAAVDEYFTNKPEVRLQTFQNTNAPAAYVVKE
jgi:hypothetical protein